VDALLVAGCSVKFLDGGWFTFAVMSTWERGRALLPDSIRSEGLALQDFVAGLWESTTRRVERTAVYAVADPATVPHALLHNLKHNQVLHARNVVLTEKFHNVPWVDDASRTEVQALGHGFWREALHFGFMQPPDVPRALARASRRGCSCRPSRPATCSAAGRWRPRHAGANLGTEEGTRTSTSPCFVINGPVSDLWKIEPQPRGRRRGFDGEAANRGQLQCIATTQFQRRRVFVSGDLHDTFEQLQPSESPRRQ
jgi:hypothetical protein